MEKFLDKYRNHAIIATVIVYAMVVWLHFPNAFWLGIFLLVMCLFALKKEHIKKIVFLGLPIATIPLYWFLIFLIAKYIKIPILSDLDSTTSFWILAIIFALIHLVLYRNFWTWIRKKSVIVLIASFILIAIIALVFSHFAQDCYYGSFVEMGKGAGKQAYEHCKIFNLPWFYQSSCNKCEIGYIFLQAEIFVFIIIPLLVAEGLVIMRFGQSARKKVSKQTKKE
ncbi:hypothetical protein ACFL3C_04070 [Patescibacteria group bacterium]